MTNNAQLLPLPELSDDDLELLHYNPNTSDVVEFLHRYAQAYAIACIEAAKPTCKQTLQVDALGSLPEPNVCYLHTPVHECDPMKLPVPQYAYSPELFRAEIAKLDSVIEFQRKTLERIEQTDLPTLRAKLAGVDGLVEELRGLYNTVEFLVHPVASNPIRAALDSTKEALATYEAAQGTK